MSHVFSINFICLLVYHKHLSLPLNIGQIHAFLMLHSVSLNAYTVIYLIILLLTDILTDMLTYISNISLLYPIPQKTPHICLWLLCALLQEGVLEEKSLVQRTGSFKMFTICSITHQRAVEIYVPTTP